MNSEEDEFRRIEREALRRAAREALAQPEQEPVAWNVIDPTGNILATEKNAIRGWARVNGYKLTVEGLLGLHELGWRVLPTSPPATKPEQEPSEWRDMIVVSLVREGIDKHLARELADHFAAQRPWQGLTDEEVQFYRKKHSKLFNAGYDKVTETNLIAEEFDSIGFYKEVSTVLKERNT